MLFKIQFTDLLSREEIINLNNDKILIMEENITEGNSLTFTDIKPLENQLVELSDTQMVIMSGIADVYMAQLGI